MAYLFRFNFNIYQVDLYKIFEQLPFVALISIIGFIVFKPYKGVVRHTGWHDVKLIIKSSGFILIIMLVLTYLTRNGIISGPFNFPLSVSLLTFIFSVILMIILRLLYKSFYYRINKTEQEIINYLIYGTDLPAIQTHELLSKDLGKRYINYGFIGDSPAKTKKNIQGIPVLDLESINEKWLTENHIDELIITSTLENNLFPEINKFMKFKKAGVKLRIIPPAHQWVDQIFKPEDIRELNMEMLLERNPILLEDEGILNVIENKTVLVTGAAGSIGKELVHQIVHYNPHRVLLLDFAESPLYELEMELLSGGNKNIIPLLLDISDKKSLRRVFSEYHPEIVFHSAAYKHVPMLERQPCNAVRTNIMATKFLMETAIHYEVEKFVQISTDKAVNPTNVMGATKRVAELLARCLHLQSNGKTKFIITRFGNVLGSNGSVIKLFQKQIRNGGPVTVTHPEITRFFMTIPEAVHLVLKATEKGKGGEIFVFDMGEPVKIMDLAKKMILLSGKQYPEDIDIKIVGLRPGEKIYEELLTDEENIIKTDHEKLYISKVSLPDCEKLFEHLSELEEKLNRLSDVEIVRLLKKIVPEYKSHASKYVSLDD